MTLIQASNGRTTVVDDSDFGWLSQYTWQIHDYNGLWYASFGVNGETVYMHRLITNAPKGQYVDHIDGDSLNNRRSNLVITSQGQNIINSHKNFKSTSGHRGVVKYRKGWKAQIKYRQQMVQSNQIYDKQEAALLRDAMVRILFPGAAYLNFPELSPEDRIVHEAERLISNQLRL